MPPSPPQLRTSDAEFLALRRNRGLYVDKTRFFEMLLAESSKYVFLARPRRFGKTLLVSALEAFFQGDIPHVRPAAALQDSRQPAPYSFSKLFRDTAVSDVVPLCPIHPVIRLNMAEVSAGSVEDLILRLRRHLEWQFTIWHRRGINVRFEPSDPNLGQICLEGDSDPAWLLNILIDCLAQHFGCEPVVLIDEYDAPITRLVGTEIPAAPFLAVLRDFYGVLKSREQSLRFVFITGISRFAQVNLFSTLNNLKDISLNPRYADLCGFTDAEVEDRLQPYLKVGARHIGCSSGQLLSSLRDHYNGYCFRLPDGDRQLNVYNPYSLITCLEGLQHREIAEQWNEMGWPNSWAESGTPEFLVRLAKQNSLNLSREAPPFNGLFSETYTLEDLDYRSLMWQTGYYTLKRSAGILLLTYPNKEVSLTFSQSLLRLYSEPPDLQTLRSLHSALRREDYGEFCRRLTTFVAGMPGEKLQKESDFHLILHALFQLMQVEFQSESHEWGGRSDLVAFFPNHICVIELKYEESAEAALKQIRDRAYGRSHHDGTRKVVGLALNFLSAGASNGPGIDYSTTDLYRP